MPEITCSDCGLSMPEIPCDACNGTGKVTEIRKANGRTHRITRPCALCHGTGQRTAGA